MTGFAIGTYAGPLVGTDLRSGAFDILSADGWDSLPSKRGAAVEIPYRDGEYSRPRRYLRAKTIPLRVLILDTDAAGDITHPGGRAGHLRENTDELLGLLFEPTYLTLIRTVVGAAGSDEIRWAVGEVTDVVPIQEEHRILREAIIQFRMIEGTWRSEDQNVEAQAGLGSGTSSFPVTTGGNAPIRGGVKGAFEVQFTANTDITNPRIEIPSTDDYIQYSGELTAGDLLLIDVGDRTAVINGTTRADSGLGAPRAYMLELPGGSSTTVETSISSGTDYDVDIRWYDRWL